MPATVVHVMRTYGVHGGERQLAQLFLGFSDKRFSNCFFFVYRDPICASHYSRIPNIKTAIVLPLRLPIFPSLIFEMLALLVFLPLLQVRATWMLWREGCRVCVAHGVQGALTCWLAAWVLRGTRFVYMHRGTKSQRGRHPLFRLLYAPFHVVAGVSKASANSLVGLTGSRAPVAIENGIDFRACVRVNAPPFKTHGGPLVVGCIGRLIPAKGHRLLLRAFALFHAEYRQSELWIAGDGPDQAALSLLSKELAIAEAVRFFAHCDDIASFLSGCDMYVHASESEGLSNAVLEAMAYALPSVVVEAPGVSECHVDGETGFVVQRNERELADALLRLARDPKLRGQMGENAYHRVCDHFSIEANCRRYVDLFEKLIGST